MAQVPRVHVIKHLTLNVPPKGKPHPISPFAIPVRLGQNLIICFACVEARWG